MSRQHHSMPPDKEGKKQDSCGRCLYSTGALEIKSCNYIACMSHYIHTIFEDLLPILQLVPDDLRQKVLQLCRDGMAAMKQNITSARHTLKTAAKTGVVLKLFLRGILGSGPCHYNLTPKPPLRTYRLMVWVSSTLQWNYLAGDR